jgi:hypothetical protein
MNGRQGEAKRFSIFLYILHLIISLLWCSVTVKPDVCQHRSQFADPEAISFAHERMGLLFMELHLKFPSLSATMARMKSEADQVMLAAAN